MPGTDFLIAGSPGDLECLREGTGATVGDTGSPRWGARSSHLFYKCVNPPTTCEFSGYAHEVWVSQLVGQLVKNKDSSGQLVENVSFVSLTSPGLAGPQQPPHLPMGP